MDFSLEELSLTRVALMVTSMDEVVVTNERIEKLDIPAVLKHKLKTTADQINSQISNWKFRFSSVNKIPTVIPFAKDVLVITSWGTVDQASTARKIVNNPAVDVRSRYLTACSYAMVEDIQNLYAGYLDNSPQDLEEEMPLVQYWNLYQKGQLEDLGIELFMSSTEFAFRVSMTVESIKYFYGLLPESQKEEHLFQKAREFCEYVLPDVVVYALGELPENRRLDLYRSDFSNALNALSAWPYLKWFETVCNSVDTNAFGDYVFDEYSQVLFVSAIRSLGCRYYRPDNERLIRMLWGKIPSEVREFFDGRSRDYDLIVEATLLGYREVVWLIWNDVRDEMNRLNILLVVFLLLVCRKKSMSIGMFGSWFPIGEEEALSYGHLMDADQYFLHFPEVKVQWKETQQFKKYLGFFHK